MRRRTISGGKQHTSCFVPDQHFSELDIRAIEPLLDDNDIAGDDGRDKVDPRMIWIQIINFQVCKTVRLVPRWSRIALQCALCNFRTGAGSCFFLVYSTHAEAIHSQLLDILHWNCAPHACVSLDCCSFRDDQQPCGAAKLSGRGSASSI